MYALNRAQIIGHLTEDPQIRQTPNGQTVGGLFLSQSFTSCFREIITKKCSKQSIANATSRLPA
jgi:single-stranded DNA-binding protein